LLINEREWTLNRTSCYIMVGLELKYFGMILEQEIERNAMKNRR
jgi:hypothetical protein